MELIGLKNLKALVTELAEEEASILFVGETGTCAEGGHLKSKTCIARRATGSWRLSNWKPEPARRGPGDRLHIPLPGILRLHVT